MRHALALALCLFGCASEDLRLGDGRAPIERDAAAEAGARSDSGPTALDAGFDAGRVPTGFSVPRVVASISDETTVDDDPSLTKDLLLIYFDSKREGGKGKEDIWSATRDDPAAAWNAAEPVAELNGDARETGIALSADGLRVFFSSDRAESQGGLDVFTADRTARDAAWSAVTRVAELSTADDDLVSAVDDTGTVCLLGRRPKGSTDYDLYVARRASVDAAWQPARAITELNTTANESDAFLAGAGNELLYTRSKDLQLARRPSLSGPFRRVGPLDELNSSSDDRDPWATADLRYVMFSSDRSGSYELYEASR